MSRQRAPHPAERDPSPLAGGLLYGVRCFAAIRLCFMGVALAADHAAGIDQSIYDAARALGTGYALALVALAAWRPKPLLHWRRLGLVDLALVGVLAYLSGGSESSLAFAYVAIPFLVAFVARPGQAALWSLATIASYVVVAGGLPLDYVAIAQLAFAAVGAVAFSAVLVRLHRLVIEHTRRESALAAELVRVEARERRKIADALHDGVAQHIADALRALASARDRGDDAALVEAIAALELAREQLRGEIFDLYPHVLDYAGLDAAVEELACRAARRGDFQTTVEVAPDAVGIDDVTVMAVLRELLANVVKHAEATRVDVRVSRPGGGLLVGVRDDGRGFDPPSPEHAVAARQFGLHAAGERLRALGGSLDVVSAPGAGTDARASIPIARHA